MYIYICFMNPNSVFVNKKKMSIQIVSILAHAILSTGFYVNTDRPVSIRIECGVRIGVLCIVACYFYFLQINFSSFTYCKFWSSIVYEKLYEVMSVQTNNMNQYFTLAMA